MNQLLEDSYSADDAYTYQNIETLKRYYNDKYLMQITNF